MFVKPEKFGGYYISKTKRLIIPYFIWSLFYSLISFISDGMFSLSRFIKIIFFGGAANPLYFLVVLWYFSMFTPLLYKYIRGYFGVLFYIAPFMLLLFFYVLQFLEFNLWKWTKFTPIWVLFYVFGIRYKEYDIRKKPLVSIILLFVSFTFEIIETIILPKYDGFAVIAYS